jgi:hypothetical protein
MNKNGLTQTMLTNRGVPTGKGSSAFGMINLAIHKPAPPDINIATSSSSMKKSMGGAAHVRKIEVEVFLTPACLTELADEGID